MLRETGGFRRRLIVTDTLFSMDGDLAPLARIAELAEHYDAMLLLDEAHATGVFGPHGRGVAERRSSHCEVGQTARLRREFAPRIFSSTIRIGTLSKALGTGGGFVCGTQSLIDWLANRARTYVFSTAQPPATSAAAIAALDIVSPRTPPPRTTTLPRRRSPRAGLAPKAGTPATPRAKSSPSSSATPNARSSSPRKLRDAGFFVPGIRPPTVPEGESLLRLSLCYHHTPEIIDALTEQLARLR